MAEDDPDDRLLAKEALAASDFLYRLDFVEDGAALMDYLYRRHEYERLKETPYPSLILLDLHMPKISGMDALGEIKANPLFRRIPTIILTDSDQEDDVLRSYDMGANSFITKSVALDSMMELIQEIGRYWLGVVELPSEPVTPPPTS
jgi:CheY-like chemotaxis protein